MRKEGARNEGKYSMIVMIVMVVALFAFAFETSLAMQLQQSIVFPSPKSGGGGDEKWRSVYLVGLSHSSAPTAQTPI